MRSVLIFYNEFSQTPSEYFQVDEVVLRKYNIRYIEIYISFWPFRLFRLLTCCITQYLVSICGRTAHVTVSLLRILQGPTLTCSHTRTKITKLKSINSKCYIKFSKIIHPIVHNWYNIFLPVPPINWSSWFGFLNSEKKRIFYC